MNLLIVDDESLTREGLISSISWGSLGIKDIYQADDGINGLAIALEKKPELILCDVRMPRMDGIRMVEEIKNKLPDTIIIFMSGYSDKEYLKAAIKLNAVNYVEKPLNTREIQETVTEAISRYEKNQKSHRGETFAQLETTAKLALQLTSPYEKNKDCIQSLLKELYLNNTEHCFFTTYIIHISRNNQLDNDQKRLFFKDFEMFLLPYHLSSLHVEKQKNYFVFHIYGVSKPINQDRKEISSFLRNRIAHFGSCFICRGETLKGIDHVYKSYETAVILSQSSYFFDSNHVLTPEIFKSISKPLQNADFFSHDYTQDLSESLLSKDYTSCENILQVLYDFFFQNTHVFFDQAKDVYYKLFNTIHEARRKMLLPDNYATEEEQTTLIRYLDQFYSFFELHQALTGEIETYFKEINKVKEENSTIYLIKDYISKHYQQESLSVKDISDQVYLSASYVCTLFKNETGMTLNQYITEYRMEKAKKLLQDPRYKITDISAKIGYNDGNYFGKIFKKTIGLSPSEYREKMS